MKASLPTSPNIAPTEAQKPLLVSIESCRKLLGGLARSTIYILINQGDIEAITLGSRRLISMHSIERLLERKVIRLGEVANALEE